MSDSLDILVILDRSGSMQDARDDHEGGLRSFVRDQQEQSGDAFFTLVQFDSHNPCEIVYDRVPIRDVNPEAIRLIPRGGTPLYQAIGEAVSHLREKLSDADDVVVMIITDGQNTDWHTEWNKESVKRMVEEREKAGWSTLFLGANIDAFAEGTALGVSAGGTVTYSNMIPNSVANVYSLTSSKLALTRSVMQEQSLPLAMAGASIMSYDADDQTAIATGADTGASKTLAERLVDYKARKTTLTTTGDTN